MHRDLKPSNVLVVEDGPRVIDFGIASGVSNTRLTMTNVAVGTPAYMSPEQAKDSRSVKGASDVFSLGSTLVFAATGHPPYHGANPVETVFMLLREGPNLEGLPDELRPLIDSCMQMDATRRPTPADLQAQLAPHLFDGGDDSGTASAWLPGTAVAMIEARRAGLRTAVVPAPARKPRGAEGPLSGPATHRPRRDAAESWVDPRTGQAAPPLPPHPPGSPVSSGEPVRLGASPVPIGPGPRATAAAPAGAGADVATGWVRPPGGASAAEAVGAVPHQASSSAASAAAPSGPSPESGRWRPWRFRMSNEVWGTPTVAA